MKFSQAMVVFMCDYIAIVEISQIDLYKMYIDLTTSFWFENFLEFTDFVTNISCRITHD
jgi:hypothetical protein